MFVIRQPEMRRGTLMLSSWCEIPQEFDWDMTRASDIDVKTTKMNSEAKLG